MALFRRPKDDGDDQWVPTDDSADFVVSERQKLIRKNRETYKQMERLWNEIQRRLRDPWKQG